MIIIHETDSSDIYLIKEFAEELVKKYRRYVNKSATRTNYGEIVVSLYIPITYKKLRLTFYVSYYVFQINKLPVFEFGITDDEIYNLPSEDLQRIAIVHRIADKWKFNYDHSRFKSSHHYLYNKIEPTPQNNRKIVGMINDFIKEINTLNKGGRRI